MTTQETNTMSQFDGHTNSSESQNNSDYLIETWDIEGSPFMAVAEWNEEKNAKEYFIVWGKWRISDKTDSREAMMAYMEDRKWDLIAAYSVALLQASREYDKQVEITEEAKAARQ